MDWVALLIGLCFVLLLRLLAPPHKSELDKFEDPHNWSSGP